MKRYHVQKGGQRTTVSLDPTLAGLLAIHFGEEPETPGAHGAVREWIQGKVGEDAGRARVSQWIAREAALLIADKKISSGYLDWLTG